MKEIMKNVTIATNDIIAKNGKTYTNYYLIYKGSYLPIKDYSLICLLKEYLDLLK